jgi:hypothetical protein
MTAIRTMAEGDDGFTPSLDNDTVQDCVMVSNPAYGGFSITNEELR